jgi:hypothetical protein
MTHDPQDAEGWPTEPLLFVRETKEEDRGGWQADRRHT